MEKLQRPVNEDGTFKDVPMPEWNRSDIIYTVDSGVMDFFEPIINSRLRLEYGWQRLGVLPYERFAELFTARITSSVNRWGPVLSRLREQAGFDLTDDGDTGTKEKTVGSQFPQNAIKPGEESYASDSTDHVSHTNGSKGWLDAMAVFNDPDNPYMDAVDAIVESVSGCFSQLIY